MKRRRALAWVWLPLLLTVFIRVGWLSIFPTAPIAPIDAEGFHLLAVNMLDGKGFAIGWDPPFCPTAVRTPLYPWFVAGVYSLLGRDPQRVIIVQILLEVLSTAGAMVLTRELITAAAEASGAGRGVAKTAPVWCMMLFAGVLYAANGTTQRFTGYLLAETLLLPLLTLALILTLRALRRSVAGRMALAAAVWGAVLLVKPNGQYLVLAVGVLLTVRLVVIPRYRCGRWLGAAGAFWVTLIMVLLPWLARNRLLLGRWTLSTAFDENVARVSAVATQAALQGIEVEPWSETWEYLYRTLELQAVPELAGIPAKEMASCELQIVWQRQIAREARKLILANKRVYLRVHLQGVLRSLLNPGHRLWYHVVSGGDWEETGVVPDIRQRMVWSLSRGAVGDALEAFWTERVWRIPPPAAVLWWGLTAVRAVVGWLVVRGVLLQRRTMSAQLVLAGTVMYHVFLPGSIAHDRFYVPVVPIVVALIACAGYNRFAERARPLYDTTGWGGHHD